MFLIKRQKRVSSLVYIHSKKAWVAATLLPPFTHLSLKKHKRKYNVGYCTYTLTGPDSWSAGDSFSIGIR